ncbi:MAG: hypothetical protein L0215_06260, partial [Gemmataceae bacterium]|nr:hypothetical protein [Gemmataceae bacterium]
PGDVEMEGCYADGADIAWTAMASAYRAPWCANYLSARSYPPGAGFRSASPADHDQEQTAQCQRLRDIFGNPFRPVAVEPAWRSAAVVELAQAIYDEWVFDFMPNLADLLEEAGCRNHDMLTHCWATQQHILGCWVIDLILGKA